MIDAPSILRGYLLNQTALTTLTGTRIWAERFNPKPGYLPSQGGAIAFRARGGNIDYSSAFLRQSWQFKCYGADEYIARNVYLVLVDVLHDAQGYPMRSATLEITGQTLSDPLPTPWPYVLCFFETVMLAQAA